MASHQDAQTILHLYDLRREAKLREARQWFITKFKEVPADEWEQHYPRGSNEDAYFRMVVSYWDMAATLVAHGALDQQLFIESGYEFLYVWVKIRGIIPVWREILGVPMMENLEKVSLAAIAWMNERNPESFARYEKMVLAQT